MENRKDFEQIDEINYFLDVAETLITKNCIRNNYGCVIVNNGIIISSGYTGAPFGRKECSELGYCLRKKLNLPSGKGYDQCRSVHAEWRALTSGPIDSIIGSTLYLVGINARNGQYVDDNAPCSICKRMIIDAGIETVVMRDTKEKFRVEKVLDWIMNDDTLFIPESNTHNNA